MNHLGYLLLTGGDVIFNDLFQQFSGALSVDVFDNRVQFDVGALQDFLQTVGFSASFLCQAFSVTGNFTQFPLLPAGDITCFQQSVAKQIRNPFCVFHIGFAAGQCFHVRRIDNHGIQIHQLKQVIQWFPKYARAFHGNHFTA